MALLTAALAVFDDPSRGGASSRGSTRCRYQRQAVPVLAGERLEEIEAICKRTREEALELLASKLPAREGALALLASKISDSWDLQRRNSFVPLRFGLELPRAPSEVERQVVQSFSALSTAACAARLRRSGRMRSLGMRLTTATTASWMMVQTSPLDKPIAPSVLTLAAGTTAYM